MADMADTGQTPHSQSCKSPDNLTSLHSERSRRFTLKTWMWSEIFSNRFVYFIFPCSWQNIVRPGRCWWLVNWVDCTAFLQLSSNLHQCKLGSYFGLWESRNLLLILGVFHFRKLGKNSTNLNHHFSSIFKGTMAWISINTKLFQTQIWLEKWYENGEILHFVSSDELGAVAGRPVFSKYFEVN